MFSLKWFHWLLQNLAFGSVDNVRDGYLNDKFSPMHCLFTHFNQILSSLYNPSSYLILDETLQPYYSVSGCDFKVYMKDKPGKYGLLFRSLSDLHSRYILQLKLYVTLLPVTPMCIKNYLRCIFPGNVLNEPAFR